MGNDASQLNRYDIACFYRKQDWLRVSISPRFQLWKHKYTQEAAEVYMLQKTPSLRDMDCYEFRSKQTDLVKVHFIDINQDTALCDTNNRIRLIVEHIPYRLSDIATFTQEEGLTVFEAALRGFRLIERQFGPVDPKEELIGFNSQGKTKIWLNKHIYLNNIDLSQFHDDTKSKNQASRIHKLYLMIEQKTAVELFPINIKEQLLSKDIKFDQALAIIRRFAYSRALSLSRFIDKNQREERTVKNSSYLKHTRQNTNTSLQTKYNQINHNLELSRKQSVASLQELPRSYTITQIDTRFDRSANHKHTKINQSPLFLRPQCLSSDYSFSNIIKSRSIPSTPPTKVSFIHTVQGLLSSNELIPDAERKYTIIQKIEAEQLAPEEQQDKQEKEATVEVINFKEASLLDTEKQGGKQQESIQKDSKSAQRQPTVDYNTLQMMQDSEKITETQQRHNPIHRVTRIQSLDQIDYNHILPQPAEQQREQVVKIDQLQSKVQKSVAVTPKQTKAEQQDFLDINFLQKSLDRKFKHHSNRVQPAPIEDDMLNIDKLQQGLIKFQKNQQTNQKQSPSLQNSNKSIDDSSKINKCQVDGNQQMTFKCLEVEQSLPKKEQPHHRTLQSIEVSTQIVQSSSYFSSRNYRSIRTDPNVFEFSFSSFNHLQQTNYHQDYRPESRQDDKFSWSNEDLSMKYPTHRHRKYNSKTDLQEKYLKHVKSKDKFIKQMPETQLEERNRFSNEIKGTIDLKSNIEQKDKVGSRSKITYEDLRSLLRTDL